jgi:8-oxo-dGTP pyrophosphatase MutT (NUDIX family)
MINVRVYGILMLEDRKVLVSDEYIRGSYITKFPGGGLEFGEGTRDCLEREFMEEMGLKVRIGRHIYTTDFYQRSAFNPDHQILSIYYEALALESISAPIRVDPFDFDERQMEVYHATGETETFRLIDWEHFSPDCVTLPIDKVVAGLIKDGLS